MLDDTELNRLRDQFFQAGVAVVYEGHEDAKLVWADSLLDPKAATLRALLAELRATMWHGHVLNAVFEIGCACAGDVLNSVPSRLDDVRDRRWQLRRELAGVVAGMDDDRLQRLVYWARSIAQ